MPDAGESRLPDEAVEPVGVDEAAHVDLLHRAAVLYYEEEANQVEVAERLGTSRSTVSRLLSEARRRGIVQITVVRPDRPSATGLAAELAAALELRAVHLGAEVPKRGRLEQDQLGQVLAPAVSRAVAAADLRSGDVLLVSSGRTVHEVAGFELPRLPGVLVAPTVGGTDQPESWFQTNEIVRRLADRVGGRPTYLFAPALPGPGLYESLLGDPAIDQVLKLWSQARLVLTGVGAAPVLRSQLPRFVPQTSDTLRSAVGDICSRFYDRDGQPIEFPGSDRLIAVRLEQLRTLPSVVAVAAGADKVAPLVAGARAGFFNSLVTDPATARAILTATGSPTIHRGAR